MGTEPKTGRARRRTLLAVLAVVGSVATPTGATAATGVVACGGRVASGQLTGAGDRVATAAHALFDARGRALALRGRCVFRLPTRSGVAVVPIRAAETTAGTREPRRAGAAADWAIARLARRLTYDAPLDAGAPPAPGATLTLVGFADGVMRRETCLMVGAAAGTFRTTCRGRPGMSGGAYFAEGRLVGVHVGVRRDPTGTVVLSYGTSAVVAALGRDAGR